MAVTVTALIVLLLLPSTFLLLGHAFYRHPPGEISHAAGWRTARAKQNQQTWDFANRLAGKCMFFLGVIELAATLGAFAAAVVFYPRVISAAVAPAMLLQGACFIFVWLHVERKLKSTFG